MFFKVFDVSAEASKTKKRTFWAIFVVWLVSVLSGMIGLANGYVMPYRYNFILVGVALILMIICLCFYRKQAKLVSKSILKLFGYVLVAFALAFASKILQDIKYGYRLQKSEICTVVRTFEVSKDFVGAPIPSNEMLIPGDKMTEGKLYVVLRHEQNYKVNVDSLSPEKIIISVNGQTPTTELTLRYESVHLVEKSVSRADQKIDFIHRLHPGDTVYLYKGDIVFPRK